MNRAERRMVRGLFRSGVVIASLIARVPSHGACTVDLPSPANVDCEHAYPIGPECSGGLVFEYGFLGEEGCCLWFSFVAATAGTYTFTVSGGEAELFYPGSPCGSLPECADGEDDNPLNFSGTLDPGTYYISISPDDCTNNSVTIVFTAGTLGSIPPSCLAEVDEAANIDCENAYAVPAGCAGFEFEYVSTGGEECCLWFSFAVSSTAVYSISVGGGPADLFQPVGGITPCVGLPICASDTAADPLSFSGTLHPGIYLIAVRPDDCTNSSVTISFSQGTTGMTTPPCEGCIASFAPEPGKGYLVNAWVQEEGAPPGTVAYSSPQVIVEFLDGAGDVIIGETTTHGPSGAIIDGWQRIEGAFTVPASGAVWIRIRLNCTAGAAFFDDVRVMPDDGSMKCYVYDPVNLRFVAELDERHYATFYEYDGEGKLARVKKETERGVMTIQETRYNSSKLSAQ